ncbi:hypothetical protein EVA_01388 [gut metagenome]|uniref:Uncharacterized protein n=1 Tax=gut metagenome TaxID=749906 RepID=J9GQ18_9ZZZZ
MKSSRGWAGKKRNCARKLPPASQPANKMHTNMHTKRINAV